MKFGESFAGMATSINRVVELYQPEEKRLFNDRFALDLLPFGWRVLLRLLFLPGLRDVIMASRERRMPGTLGAFLCRTCYIDDVLRQALAEPVQQVVILGAGFDSRAYRIAGIEKTRVFEVDLPGLVQAKQDRVTRVLGAVPAHVTYVGIDFDRDDLNETMERAGYRRGAKTLFIWESVTQYITAAAVDGTLRFVTEAPGKGSTIVFTYVRQGLIDGSDASELEQQMASMVARLGSPWIFGIDPAVIERFLTDRGLSFIEEVDAAEYQKRYLVPLGRELEVIEIERAVLAGVDSERQLVDKGN
jgi:methyltransferase (TIGR00027 family)